MRLLLLALTFSIISCGKNINDLFKIDAENDPRKTFTTDKEFNLGIQLFLKDYEKYNNGESIDVSHIPINFGEDKKNTLGACYLYGKNGKWREIKINKSYWNKRTLAEQEALIKHELGHCLLDRDHLDERYEGIQLSIMNSYELRGTFIKFKNGYNEELFTLYTINLKNDIDKKEM